MAANHYKTCFSGVSWGDKGSHLAEHLFRTRNYPDALSQPRSLVTNASTITPAPYTGFRVRSASWVSTREPMISCLPLRVRYADMGRCYWMQTSPVRPPDTSTFLLAARSLAGNTVLEKSTGLVPSIMKTPEKSAIVCDGLIGVATQCKDILAFITSQSNARHIHGDSSNK